MRAHRAVSPEEFELNQNRLLYKSYQETEDAIIEALESTDFDPGYFDKAKVIVKLKDLLFDMHFLMGMDIINQKPSKLSDQQRAWLRYRLKDYAVEIQRFYSAWRPLFEKACSNPQKLQTIETYFSEHFHRIHTLHSIVAPKPNQRLLAAYNYPFKIYEERSSSPFYYDGDNFWFWQGFMDGFNNNNSNMYLGYWNGSYYDGYLAEKGAALIYNVGKIAVNGTVKISMELANGAKKAIHLIADLAHGVMAQAPHALAHLGDEMKHNAEVLARGVGRVADAGAHDMARVVHDAGIEAHRAIECIDRCCNGCGNCLECCAKILCECSCRCGNECLHILGIIGTAIVGGGVWLYDKITGQPTADSSNINPQPNPNPNAHALTVGADVMSSHKTITIEGPILTPLKYTVAGLFVAALGTNVAINMARLAKRIWDGEDRAQNSTRLSFQILGGVGGYFAGFYVPGGGKHMGEFLAITMAWLSHFLIDHHFNKKNGDIYDAINYSLLDANEAGNVIEKQMSTKTTRPGQFWLNSDALIRLYNSVQSPDRALRDLPSLIRGAKFTISDEIKGMKQQGYRIMNALGWIWNCQPRFNSELQNTGLIAISGFRQGLVNQAAQSLMTQDQKIYFADRGPDYPQPSAQGYAGQRLAQTYRGQQQQQQPYPHSGYVPATFDEADEHEGPDATGYRSQA